jgi:hypothetical protein
VVDFDGECVRFKDPVTRFDVATGQQAAVSWESYWATRSSWPRTLMSPPHGEEIADAYGVRVVRPPHADPKLFDDYSFRLEGTRLVGDDRGVDVTVRLARTGEPLRVRVPASSPSDRYFSITQWLDDYHLVMAAEDGSLLVCRVPDGRCRTTVQARRHHQLRGTRLSARYVPLSRALHRLWEVPRWTRSRTSVGRRDEPARRAENDALRGRVFGQDRAEVVKCGDPIVRTEIVQQSSGITDP